MPVSNRIKILKCCSFEEVENKVNDFLAFDEHIEQLVGIDYRLEFNVVIIEYYVMSDRNDKNDNKMMMGSGDYSYMYNSPFTGWLKLYFPSFLD
jgi:hypothetical protein